MKVVSQLADILKQRGMSRAEVARQAGIAPSTVGNLAKAHYLASPVISLGTLAKVCVVLGLAPGDVLKLQN